MQNLIEMGFLDTDFDGSSGEYSSDDYLSDYDSNESHLEKPKERELSSKNVIIDNFDIDYSDKITADDIMKQTSMHIMNTTMEEMKYHSTDIDSDSDSTDSEKYVEYEPEDEEGDEAEIDNDELHENDFAESYEIKDNESYIFYALSLSAYSELIIDDDEDRENDTDSVFGSDYYYLTSDMTEESEFSHGDITETFSLQLLIKINIITDIDDMNTNNIYKIIAEYSEQ